MWNRLIVLSGALISLAAPGLPQEDTSGVSGPDAIAARQASLDMSSITFRSMGFAMKAGKRQRVKATRRPRLQNGPRLFRECFRLAPGRVRRL